MAYTTMVGEVSVVKATSSTMRFSLAHGVKLSGYPSSFLIRALADEPQVSSVCVPGEGVTKCTCAAQESDSPKQLEATFSEKLSALELVCGQQSFAPEVSDNKRVCPADTSDFKDCKDNNARTKSIDLTTLLTGNTESIKWEAFTRAAQDTTKKLSIPPTNLPYTDQHFAVGCLNNDKTTAKCKLTVAIEARASVTQDQTVTCAYGKTSNQKHQSIKLSPSQNKFTLVCGKDGEVLPTNYQSTFCVSKNGVNASAECSGTYTDVIPAYETKWWKHDATQHTFTLEIPEGGFPEKETLIMVGCQKSKNAADTDNKTVTCAYGKTSNQKHQSIKLSPSQNKFTLVCGKDGEVLPTNYQSTFCVSKNGVNASAECSGTYTDVIPAYETKWWKHDATQHTFTLEIPEGGFPEKETLIMVGCQKSKNAADTDNKVREEASSDSPTVCSVDVTLEAVPSSASLSGGIDGVFSWFCSVGAFLTVSHLMM
ncbi:UNVERIFIED_CONTAM: SAG-related sequence SRS38D [Hammondia hammondi]|eukprot:XP_008888917.1 SAG-related sequence SRS38D [Hammondia hammondi]